MYRLTILERAYELARSGQFTRLKELRARLKLEGFELVEDHLRSSTVRRDLKLLSERSRRDELDPPHATMP